MARKYYAGYNSYGIDVSYHSDGWSAHVFDSKRERDEWVKNTNNSEVITRKEMLKIVGNPTEHMGLIYNTSNHMIELKYYSESLGHNEEWL